MTLARVDGEDARLLRRLHDEHAAALWRFALTLLGGDHAKAQDVVQETFLRAWRNPRVLDQRSGSARPWLFTVARRIVIDDWRMAQRRPELVAAEPPERAAADPTDQVVDRQVLLEALRALSTEHREVVLECYVRGASVAEAAATLGIPEGTVKSRAHYALHALRDALHHRGGIT